MASVNGKALLFLQFDDSQPVSIPTDAVPYLWIYNNVGLIGAALELAIRDTTGTLLNPTPGDGSIVKVKLGTTPETLREYEFFLVGAPRTAMDEKGTYLVFHGLVNIPKLFYEVAKFSEKARSSDAIQKIATTLGMSSWDIDASQGDDMIWLSGNRRWGKLLASIAEYGWFGPSSAASVVGVDANKCLFYKNLGMLAKQKPRHAIYYRKPSNADESDYEFTYSAAEVTRTDTLSRSTALTGYNATATYLDKNGVPQKHDTVEVTRQNESLNMSARIKEDTGANTRTLMPMGGPNTHPFYQQAFYQNVRYRATFSAKVNVLLTMPTDDVSLFTPMVVLSTLAATGTEDDPLLATKGLVEAHVIGIYNGNYLEKIVLAAQGSDSPNVSSPQT